MVDLQDKAETGHVVLGNPTKEPSIPDDKDNVECTGAVDVVLPACSDNVPGAFPCIAAVIILACFCTLFVIVGTLWASGVLFAILLNEFNESRGNTALVSALMFCALLLSVGLSGHLQRQFSPRGVCGVGAVLSAIGLATSALAQELWHLYPTLALFGIGGGISYPVGAAAVSAWFTRNRALATALAFCGSSSGAIVIALVLRPLVEAIGVRSTFLVFAIVQLLLVGISAAAFRKPPVPSVPPQSAVVMSKPSQHGAEAAVGSLAKEKTSEHSVWSCPGFACLALGCGLMALGFWVPVVHGVRFLRDLGFSPREADEFTQALGFGGLFGRVPLGILADRFGRIKTLAVVAGLMSLLVFVLYIFSAIGQVSRDVAWAWAFCYGGFTGGSQPLIPVATADVVGISRLSMGYSITWGLAAAPGVTLGPVIAGVLFDQLGSYEVPFALSGCMLLLSCAAISMSFLRVSSAKLAKDSGG